MNSCCCKCKSSKEVSFNLSCPLTTSNLSLQHPFFIADVIWLASESFSQLFALVKTAVSIRVVPQKCFSIVNENVDKSTKSANVIEKILCNAFFITKQIYKKLNYFLIFTKVLTYYCFNLL